MIDENLKRAIILDHYQNPRNKGLVEDKHYHSAHMASDSCIDDIKVQVDIEDGVVKDARFDGVGCTIAVSSTSIITDLVKGKTVEEALAIIDEYYNMLDEKPFSEDKIEEMIAFETLPNQANRIKCGTIGVKGINSLLREYQNENGK